MNSRIGGVEGGAPEPLTVRNVTRKYYDDDACARRLAGKAPRSLGQVVCQVREYYDDGACGRRLAGKAVQRSLHVHSIES